MTSIIQSNTQDGDLSLIADGTVTEGYLVKLSTVESGQTRVILPTDVADECPFVALETAADNAAVDLRPLTPGQSVRLIAAGTIAGGDRVYLSATFGKVVTATGAGADTYFSPGIAETDATAGGYVRVRVMPRVVVVT